MQFQIQDLKKLLYSIQQNHIKQIYIKSCQFELNISKASLSTKNLLVNKKIYQDQQIKNSDNEQQHNIQKKQITNHISETYSTIVSPMVGTFYRSPAPNEAAFIEKYDIVQQKQIVCIIEAMKLMNEIESEVNGEIIEILVNDGDIVDCGQALMKVKAL